MSSCAPSFGRAIVELDADACDLGYIAKVVERIERELGLEALPGRRPPRRGDEPLLAGSSAART
ncbi:MAG: hypothetical protein KIT14_11905 [bacterium]|nr:hypothetical protein [bacterium]